MREDTLMIEKKELNCKNNLKCTQCQGHFEKKI